MNKLSNQPDTPVINNRKIKCEIYTRVCGFYRPVSQFNKGKKEEYKDRKEYIVTGI